MERSVMYGGEGFLNASKISHYDMVTVLRTNGCSKSRENGSVLLSSWGGLDGAQPG